ncbi:MAG: Fe-S protein assembly co-chaperone HscB [Polyangiaceae bacterium]|jgi:molecular chaperone HscB|nr:Fe-S protein assembly co-chaperone HscB [Polyangiaceae bacterium]
MDPFDVFGIPPGFDLEIGALERRQRELARVVHPDRFARAGAVERRRALSRAVDVNEALRVLRDPVRRAEALLQRLGVASGELAEPKAPPHLLMEMMEQREALAAAHEDGNKAELERLGAWARAREAGVLGELSAGFARALAAVGEGAGGSAGEGAGGKAGEGAGGLVGRLGELRYLRRFVDEVDAFEEDLASRPERGAEGASEGLR